MSLFIATVAGLASSNIKMASPCIDTDRADRHACRQTQPIQTSAVYLLGPKSGSQFTAIPPPSPPSPITPASDEECGPITDLSLDLRSQPHLEESIPPTPNTSDADHHSSLYDSRLASAMHSLTTTSNALTSLTSLYTNTRHARDAFDAAVATIVATQQRGLTSEGKLILIGVGKSGYIARKLAATMTSLGVPAVFLHAAEALHGDLGCISPRDALLFVTYSGRTPELLALLPHLHVALPMILLTGCCCSEGDPGPDVVLARRRQQRDAGLAEDEGGVTVVLPAPVHEEEVASYGVAAPTTSTSVALALGDALAMAAAGEVHGRGRGVGNVFRSNHPGGAIGEVKDKLLPLAKTIGEVCVRWESIHVMDEAEDVVAGDVLRAGYASKTGWVRLQGADGAVVSPSGIRTLQTADLGRHVREVEGLALQRPDLLAMAAETKVSSAVEWMRCATRDGENVVIAVLERGEIAGVLEAAELLKLAAQK